jgi:hypothetical protein
MKKSLIAFVTLSALSSVAFATDGSNGESKYGANTIASPSAIVSIISADPAVALNGSNGESQYEVNTVTPDTGIVSALSTAPEATTLIQNRSFDDERRLDEKNGSRG